MVLQVLAKDHSLRKWLIAKHNMLRGSVQSEDVSSITSAFECLLQANSEAGTQEEGRHNCDEDTSATSSSSSKRICASTCLVNMEYMSNSCAMYLQCIVHTLVEYKTSGHFKL